MHTTWTPAPLLLALMSLLLPWTIPTQSHKATQCLPSPEDVTGAHEELVLHAWIALVALLAVHVPAAGGVLKIL